MPRPRLISYAIVVRLLTMMIVWLFLLVWFLNAYRANCAASLAALGMLTAFLLVAGIERSFLLRRALFNECLSSEGRLFNLFYNRIFITIRETMYAFVLAAFLLASSLVFEPRQWSLLFIDLLLLALLIPRLTESMAKYVHQEYRYALARQWATWLSVLLLWGEAVMALTISPPEYYGGMRWQEVVTYGVSEPEVACPLVAELARIYMVGIALAIWSVQNVSRLINDPTQAIMIWVGFVTLFGFTFMMALAFSRALAGVMGRPWEMWRKPAHSTGNAQAASPSQSALEPDQP